MKRETRWRSLFLRYSQKGDDCGGGGSRFGVLSILDSVSLRLVCGNSREQYRYACNVTGGLVDGKAAGRTWKAADGYLQLV